MSQISEPSEPSALDGALVPYAEDLGSAIATIQHVMERLQVLGAQLDSGIELEGASLTPTGMSSTPEHHTVSVGSAPVTASDNVSASAPRWHSITSNTDRIPGSNVPRCDTEAEAQLVFDTALDAGLVERVDVVITRDRMTRVNFPIGTYCI